MSEWIRRRWWTLRAWWNEVFGEGCFYILCGRGARLRRDLHCIVHLHRTANYTDDGKLWAIGCGDCGMGRDAGSLEFEWKPTGGEVSHIRVQDRA